MENALPLLQKVVSVTKAYIRDVELGVLGSVQSDSPSFMENVPPKKQQVSTCASICARWGKFPRGESSLDLVLRNFARLPLHLKKPSLAFLLKSAHDDSFFLMNNEETRSYAEVLHATVELFLADWIEAALGEGAKLDDPEITSALEERALIPFTQQTNSSSSSSWIVPKFLSKRADSFQQSMVSAWYWSGLVLKLRTLSYLRWTEVLGIINGNQVDNFVLNRLTVLASDQGGQAGATTLSLVAFDLKPKTLAGSHLPLILMQAYSNADDDSTRECLLETLRAVLERADLRATPDAVRAANKAIVLAESALKGSKEVKDMALKLVAAVLAKTLEDDFDLLNNKLLSSRVTRPLQGADAKKFARALDLCRVLLENAKTVTMKRKLAQMVSVEVFERSRSAVRSILKVGTTLEVDDDFLVSDILRLIFLADPVTAVTKSIPALLANPDPDDSSPVTIRRTIILFTALKLILEDAKSIAMPQEAMDKLFAFVTSNVIPHLDLLVSALSTSSGWQEFAELPLSRISSTEDMFFSSLIVSPHTAALEFRSKVFMRRSRRGSKNYLRELLFQFRSYGGPFEVDALTESKYISLTICVEVLGAAREANIYQSSLNSSIGKSNGLPPLPPLALMYSGNFHPFLREVTMRCLKSTAYGSFAEFTTVLKAMRDHIAGSPRLVLAEELSTIMRDAPAKLRIRSPAEIIAKTRDLGPQLEALAMAISVCGADRSARDFICLCDRLGLWVTCGGGARELIRVPSSTAHDLVHASISCSPQSQGELVRLLTSWLGRLKPSGLIVGEGDSLRLAPLVARGIPVLATLDASSVPLEALVFDVCLTRNKPDPLFPRSIVQDALLAADHSVKGATTILSRAFQWWRSNQSAAPHDSTVSPQPPPSGSNGPRKSFSVLRRFTATSFSSSTNASGTMVLSPPQQQVASNAEDTIEEDEVLMGIVRSVLQSGNCLGKSLGTHQGGSPPALLKLVRDIIALFSGANPLVKRRRLSSRFALDLFAVIKLVAFSTADWVKKLTGREPLVISNNKLVDDIWARAERRRTFGMLRRLSGFSDSPVAYLDVVNSNTDLADSLRKTCIEAITALVSLGPVALGQVADAPDASMWPMLVRYPPLCSTFMAAHWTSLLPSYFGRAFPLPKGPPGPYGIVSDVSRTFVFSPGSTLLDSAPPGGPLQHVPRNGTRKGSDSHTGLSETVILTRAVVDAMRRQLFVDSASGRAACEVVVDPVGRALLLCFAFLGASQARYAMTDLFCAALTTYLDEASGMMIEVDHVIRDLSSLSLEDRTRRLAHMCARTCPELSSTVLELFWERQVFSLSEPFAQEMSESLTSSWLDKAWSLGCTAEVWKSLPDETASLAFLMTKALEVKPNDGGLRAYDLVHEVALKSSWETVESVLLPFVESERIRRTLCQASLPLFANAFQQRFDRPKEPLVQLLVAAFVYEDLFNELLRWLRIQSLEHQTVREFLSRAESSHQSGVTLHRALTRAAAECLVDLDGDLCRELLDETLLRLSSSQTADVDPANSILSTSKFSTASFLSDGKLDSSRLSERVVGETLVGNLARAASEDMLDCLYSDLRSMRILPIRFLPREEAFILASRGISSVSSLIALVRNCGGNKVGLDFLLPLTLSCLVVLWRRPSTPTSTSAVSSFSSNRLSDPEEREPIRLQRSFEKLLIALLQIFPSVANPKLVESAFWIGLENLLRIAMTEAAATPNLDVHAHLLASAPTTLQCVTEIAQIEPSWVKITKVLSDRQETFGDVSEETLVLIFRIAKENANEEWMARAMSSPTAQSALASVALREIICDPDFVLSSSERIASCASNLVSRARTISPEDLCDRYQGVLPVDEALLTTAQRFRDGVDVVARGWTTASTPGRPLSIGRQAGQDRRSSEGPHDRGSGSAKHRKSVFVTVRQGIPGQKRGFGESPVATQLDEDPSIVIGSQAKRVPPSNTTPSRGSANSMTPERVSGNSRRSFGDDRRPLGRDSGGLSSPASQEGLKLTKKKRQIMDVRDALHDPIARGRLLAHAADRGIPQHLVLAYESVAYIPELDKDDLWHSFQRSRWWLFEEEH